MCKTTAGREHSLPMAVRCRMRGLLCKTSAGRERACTMTVCMLQDEDAFDPDQIPGASPSPDRPNGNLQRVSWMPVEHALKPEWSWADWVRYWFYR